MIGPDEDVRFCYRLVSGRVHSAAGMPARICTDLAMTIAPVGLLFEAGGLVPVFSGAAVVNIDQSSKWPKFQYPDGTLILYGTVNGGPVQRLPVDDADRMSLAETRLDELEILDSSTATEQFVIDGLNEEAAFRSSAIAAEATIRAANDSAETSARTAADTSEATARAAADSAEATARAAADSSEATARVAGDATTAANAAAALSTHEADNTNIHGITDTALLETQTGAQSKANTAQSNAIAAAVSADVVVAANAASALAGKVDKGALLFNVVDYGADPTGTADSLTAFNAAITAAGAGVVYAPAGTYLLSASPTFSAKTCSLRGCGAGTILRGTSSGPVLDFAGWAGPGKTVGNLAVEGNNTAGQVTNAGIKLSSAVSLVGAMFHDIRISKTGGAGFDLGIAELCDFTRIMVTEPVGAATNDVAYFTATGAFNGNRLWGCALNATSSGANMGASGAVVIKDNGTNAPHDNLIAGWWIEFLHPSTGQAIFALSGNGTTVQDPQFFDVSKVTGATGTSYVRFSPPAVADSGGNTFRGLVPGKDPGVATSPDCGIDMLQSRNRVQGTKGYRGTNVILAVGVANTYIEIGGAFGAALDASVVDNSGSTSNVVIDSYLNSWRFGTAATVQFGATGPSLRAGAGSPEGVVTAAVSSMYMRTNGAAGTSWYVKETGTGNTGWRALPADADAVTKGNIQLAGDLAGTAASPTIATGAITSAKILDGTIVDADISSGAAIAQSKISGLTAALAAKAPANGIYVATDPQWGYTSGTDIAAACQAAINAMPSTGTVPGGILYIPPGDWTFSTPVILKTGVRVTGGGRTATRIAGSAGLFRWTASVSNLVVEHLNLRSTSGHIFAPSGGSADWGIYTSVFRDCTMFVSDPNASIFYHVSGADYDNVTVADCSLTRASTATVPAWYVVNSGGAANQNRWQRLWANSGNATAAPFFWLESTSSGNYAYDNRFEDITGEQNPGGLLHAFGTFSLVVQNVYDYDASVTYTADVVKVGKSAAAGALRSYMAFVSNSGRRGGTLGASVFDINLVPNDAQRCTLLNPNYSNIGTGLKLNFSTADRHTIIGAPQSAWTGQDTNVSHYFGTQPQFSAGALIGTAQSLAGAGSPEGSVTAPVGSTYRRTDGVAGSSFYLKDSGTGNTGWRALPVPGTTAGTVLSADVFDAKGDLVAATAADTAARLPVGVNGTRLVADSTTSTGLKWSYGAGPVFNVLDYGAAGDGTTDDTTAIQACITAAPAGSKIFFPPGTYIVSAILLPKTGTTFYGVRGKSIIQTKSAVTGFNVFQVGSTVTDVSFEDMTIDLNKAGTTDPGANTAGIGIYIAATSGGTGYAIRRVEVKNGHQVGIRFLGHNTPTDPASLNASEAVIDGCYVHDCTKQGIMATSTTDLRVVNCRTASNGQEGIFHSLSRNTVITGCTAQSNGGHGIVATYVESCKVANNSARSNGAWGIAMGGGSTTNPANRRYVVYGNTCDANASGGITNDPTVTGAADVPVDLGMVLTHNVCFNNTANHGIYLQNVKNAVVSSNVCFGNASAGIAIHGTYCTVAANLCHSNSQYGISLQAAGSEPDAGHHRISGNLLYGNTTSNLSVASGIADIAYGTAGTGSPEGVVAAPVSSIYQRTDGGTGTSLYIKETGTGNTGWVTHGASSSGDASTNTTSSVDSEIALFSGTAGKTIKRATGTGIAALTSGVLSTVTAPTGTIVGTSDTQTLTNKRITSRVTSTASSATPTPSMDSDDVYAVTALAANATFGAPTGTPTDGQNLLIRIKDNGTARTLAWNATYRAIGVTLPTTTVVSKTLYIGGRWNASDSKVDILAVAQEA